GLKAIFGIQHIAAALMEEGYYDRTQNTRPWGPGGEVSSTRLKNVPFLMSFHNIAYTATASLAHLDDYASKLQKAMEAVNEEMVYLHVLTPCPTGWRNATEDAIEVSRAAVETNY